MSSIIRRGKTFYGRGVVGRGVYKHVDGRRKVTYAGQHKDGCACGLGGATLKHTRSDGSLYMSQEYAEYGPDGWCDGRCVCRGDDGGTDYYLYERGELSRERATGPGAVLGFIMYTRGEPKE